jgi:hypothetical protein
MFTIYVHIVQSELICYRTRAGKFDVEIYIIQYNPSCAKIFPRGQYENNLLFPYCVQCAMHLHNLMLFCKAGQCQTDP